MFCCILPEVVRDLTKLIIISEEVAAQKQSRHRHLTYAIKYASCTRKANAGIVCKNHAICSPGHLHGVLGEIHDPVDQVEGAKREGEEDAGVFVDDAGAGQHVVVRYSRALLQEGLGVDRWVGERFGRAVEQLSGVHPLLQHASGIHLGEAKT